jgi:hypothetical protein
VLKLRSGVVRGVDPLEVEVDGELRAAWADQKLVGRCEEGDDVVVNTAALDLELGSGGFDVVHVNLTRGLAGGATADGVHVIKLNYTSLQHAVEPVELPADSSPRPRRRPPTLVLPLHGHLAPACWATHSQRPGLEIGFIQTAGAALTASLSRDVDELRDRGLITATISVGASCGADHEAISLPGALQAAADGLGWDAAILGPGPGILGSETRYGNGGLAALESAHASLALGLPTLLSPRLSSGDARPRHRGVSHHTRSVLELALEPLRVAVPAEAEELWPDVEGQRRPAGSAELIAVCAGRHQPVPERADLDGYAESGLPRRTMGRDLEEDRLFFAAPLAAGRALAQAASAA